MKKVRAIGFAGIDHEDRRQTQTQDEGIGPEQGLGGADLNGVDAKARRKKATPSATSMRMRLLRTMPSNKAGANSALRKTVGDDRP